MSNSDDIDYDRIDWHAEAMQILSDEKLKYHIDSIMTNLAQMMVQVQDLKMLQKCCVVKELQICGIEHNLEYALKELIHRKQYYNKVLALKHKMENIRNNEKIEQQTHNQMIDVSLTQQF